MFSNGLNGHADKWTLASCNSNCSHTMTYVLEDSYATIKFPVFCTMCHPILWSWNFASL